jgi:hypothetical protein
MMSSPALLDSLAGDTEPGADLSPGVTAGAQALDGLGYGGVDLLGQAEHEDQGLDVAVADTATVGAQDAADECPYSSFSTDLRRLFGVNPALTLDRLSSSLLDRSGRRNTISGRVRPIGEKMQRRER